MMTCLNDTSKVSRRVATVNQTRPFFLPPQIKQKKAVWLRETKQCCAVNCFNVFLFKEADNIFINFHLIPKSKWVAAINRKGWYPTECT